MILNDLLISQKDTLFRILVQNGFNPKDFNWEKVGGIPTLCYAFDNYYCTFQMSDDLFSRMLIFSPGKSLTIENFYKDLFTWESYEKGFINWLQYLKRELNSDFLWEKLFTESNKIALKKDVPIDNFTPSEREMINYNFEKIKVELGLLDINKKDIETIKEKLDHLLELTEKLNKIDWLNILIGSFMGLFLSLTLTPETIRSIWEILRNSFEFWLVLP